MTVGRTVDTKDRVLDAAQKLFGEHGLEGTSLRAITNAAGANLAAVNYHFGSKEELFRAVARRAIGPVTEEHQRRMEEMDDEPSAEELLDAFVGPYVRLISHQQDRSLARLVGRILTDSDAEIWSWITEQTAEIDAMYLEAFGRAMPHLPHDELLWRFHAMFGTVIFQLLGAPLMEVAGETPPLAKLSNDTEELLARTIVFLAAGLRAPAA